jgi:hypothetical protein
MSTSMQREELIEKFVMGELEGSDLQSFENDMAADASLKEEVQLQQDIVNAISEKRRIAIKQRLEAINVGGASYTGYYVAAGITSIIIVGLMTFLSGVFDSEKAVQLPDDKESQTEIVESQETEIHDVQEEEINTAIIEEEVVSESVETNVSIAEAPVSENEESDIVEEEQVELPVIDKPVLPENDVEDEFVNTEIESPSGKELNGAKIEVSKVQVEIDTDSDYDFHYKYFNSKLYLYGDFSSAPYELIELNTDKSRDLYMYFKGKYYALESNKIEITKLTPLRDKIIIRGLDNLR